MDQNNKLGKVIAVASGKGGVGKSTVAVNLACALAQLGNRVGLLDADIYGPSQHIMLGLSDQDPVLNEDKKIMPIQKHGLSAISFGFFVKADDAVIWRGPMIARMFQQFVKDVEWGEQDYFIVDLPPGTGDIQLTMAQTLAISGIVIVTTPQNVALADAIKGINMFRKVNIEILGIVENMSHYVCAHCGHESSIFSSKGGEKIAQKMAAPFLGRIPLEEATCLAADAGIPIVLAEPDSSQAQHFTKIAKEVVKNAAAITPKNLEVASDNTAKEFAV